MSYSNSPLAVYTKMAKHKTSPRRQPIRKITIHHTSSVTSIENLGGFFAGGTREASSNYGIGNDGRIGLFVEEKDRAWTSSSPDNDHQAVTIEVSNSKTGEPWPVSDAALNATIRLCVDICQRNRIDKLIFTGNASGNLTQHNYFAATDCPGTYLKSKYTYIADEVNRRLSNTQEDDMQYYQTLESIPSWAQPTIKKLIKAEVIQGEGSTDKLNLSTDMLRMLVFFDRAGLFKGI